MTTNVGSAWLLWKCQVCDKIWMKWASRLYGQAFRLLACAAAAINGRTLFGGACELPTDSGHGAVLTTCSHPISISTSGEQRVLLFAHTEPCFNKCVVFAPCRRDMCGESYRLVLLGTWPIVSAQLHLQVQSHHSRGEKKTVPTRVPQCFLIGWHTAQVSTNTHKCKTTIIVVPTAII